jgi:hypothetical protein
MPAHVKTVTEMNSILGGQGAVDLAEALVALAGATGIAVFAKKIGLWPKFSAVEKTEVEMLDAEMPDGFWRRMKDVVSASTMTGKKVRWRHGEKVGPGTGWAVGQDAEGNLLVTTPMLDEETNTLV